ncbi:ornithine carbamoyltransferase [Streptomyces sp. NPDC020192]|uniref:ornithine carbamoyltransferase n=1 Tax=Streptomyces sp. NPDC020192 TaxID=3365066 RepID=UPI0037BBD16B
MLKCSGSANGSSPAVSAPVPTHAAADTARVLSSYLDAITVRTFDHATVEQMADASTVPVVNALSNSHHPCQSLADLLALREHFGTLVGLTTAFIGDGTSNTCNSFLAACAASGMHLIVAPRPATRRTRTSSVKPAN